MKSAKPYFVLAAKAGQILKEHLPAEESVFYDSVYAQDAVCMRFQVMGENLAKVRKHFPEVFEQYADQTWIDLIAIRNVISHGYDEIELPILWDVAVNYLDAVIEQLQRLADPNFEL